MKKIAHTIVEIIVLAILLWWIVYYFSSNLEAKVDKLQATFEDWITITIE